MKNAIVKMITVISILLFLYTGIYKLIEYPVFKEQIAMSPILRPFTGTIAWLLPTAEFLTAILLIIPNWRLYGFYIGTFLMVIFTIYFMSILTIDKRLPCSCGGILEELSWQQHLLINCFFIFLGFTGIRLQKHIQSKV